MSPGEKLSFLYIFFVSGMWEAQALVPEEGTSLKRWLGAAQQRLMGAVIHGDTSVMEP